MATRDETDSNAAIAGYGSAIDMAVKIPTLSGALFAWPLAPSFGRGVNYDAGDQTDFRTPRAPTRPGRLTSQLASDRA